MKAHPDTRMELATEAGEIAARAFGWQLVGVQREPYSARLSITFAKPSEWFQKIIIDENEPSPLAALHRYLCGRDVGGPAPEGWA